MVEKCNFSQVYANIDHFHKESIMQFRKYVVTIAINIINYWFGVPLTKQ